jgi:hypothetical protein
MKILSFFIFFSLLAQPLVATGSPSICLTTMRINSQHMALTLGVASIITVSTIITHAIKRAKHIQQLQEDIAIIVKAKEYIGKEDVVIIYKNLDTLIRSKEITSVYSGSIEKSAVTEPEPLRTKIQDTMKNICNNSTKNLCIYTDTLSADDIDKILSEIPTEQEELIKHCQEKTAECIQAVQAYADTCVAELNKKIEALRMRWTYRLCSYFIPLT